MPKLNDIAEYLYKLVMSYDGWEELVSFEKLAEPDRQEYIEMARKFLEEFELSYTSN